jgi:hypothetical protein
MNRPNVDPSITPAVIEPSTASTRSHSLGTFSAGVATGFVLCGVLLGSGFGVFQQLLKQPANQASIPAAEPAPMASAPSASIPPTAPATTASVQPATVAAPVAPATDAYETNGTDGSSNFNVRVVELKRVSGNSVLLKLAITNTGQTSGGFPLLNVTRNESIYVVDTQTQQKAYPLKDTKGTAVASQPLYSLDPGQTAEIFAQFPAPPVTTQRFTIYFPKASSPIADVPITP